MKKYIVLLIVVIPIAACRVTFVPASSANMIGQVTLAAKTTDSLYLAIQFNNDKGFITYKPVYVQLQSTINSIRLQDSIRPKSAILLMEIDRMKKTFINLMYTHQAKGSINNAEAEIYRNIMSGLWAPILVTENSYK